MKAFKKPVLVFLFILFVLTIVGCQNSRIVDADNSVYRLAHGHITDSVRFSVLGLKTFNPYFFVSQEEKFLSSFLHGSLFVWSSAERAFIPFLAISGDIGQASARLLIREGMVDSGGTPMDAQYLADCFTILQKVQAKTNSSDLAFLAKYVFAADGKYLQIGFQTESSSLFELFTMPLPSLAVCRAVADNPDFLYKYGTLSDLKEDFPAFTGPWMLDKADRNRIVLVRNESVCKALKGKGYTSHLVFDLHASAEDAMVSFINGDDDVIMLSRTDIPFIEKQKGYVVYRVRDPFSIYALIPNFNSFSEDKKKILRDLSFRKALASLIDFPGETDRYVSPVFENKFLRPYSQFPAGAEKFVFTLNVIKDDAKAYEYAKKITDSLGKSRMKVVLTEESLNTMLAKIYATRDWDLFVTRLPVHYPLLIDPEMYFLKNYEHIMNIDRNGDDYTASEKKLSDLMNQLFTREFLQHPAVVYEKLEKGIAEELPYIPLGYDYLYIAAQANVRNFWPSYADNCWEIDKLRGLYIFKE